MDWHEISLKIGDEEAEKAMGVLADCGMDSLQVQTAAIVDDLHRDKEKWDYADEDLIRVPRGCTILKGYVPADSDPGVLLSGLRARLDAVLPEGGYALSVASLKDKDWNEEWKKHFKPIRVGQRLVIKPSWETLSETGEAEWTDRLVIELDPGLAFGTGTHETTRMCLEFMQAYVREGMRVADIGCGSGILSLAAAKLGASKVVAIDLDEDAVRSARENAVRNRVEAVCDVRRGDLVDHLDEPVDFMAANIIFEVVVGLLDTAAPFVKPGGILLVSGILAEKTEAMEKAVARSCGFERARTRTENGWTAMVLRRIDQGA